MIVNALIVHNVNGEPSNSVVRLKPTSSIANHVFDKDRIVVCLHRHMTLICSLEQSVNGSRCRSLCDINQFFDPDYGRFTGFSWNTTHFDRYLSSLIVSSVVTNSLTAGA